MNIFRPMITTAFLRMLFLLAGLNTITQSMSGQTFTVTPVSSENGSYTIHPKISADGKVAAGSVLTVSAKPSTGYSLDAIYYTFKGGMWGTTSNESFASPMKITVDKDMSIGSTFVENALVENLKVTHDVMFAQPGVKPLKYDVFSPKGARNLPVIIIIHGGGWSSNNEDIMRGLARELAKGNRYVVFSIDYRWINERDGDAQPTYMHKLIEDVFGAIAHIQEHAARYGADPTRLAVTGDSAGGHLSEAAALFSTFIGNAGFGKHPGVYQYLPTYMPKGRSVDEVKKDITNSIKAVAPSYGPSEASDFKQFIEQTDQAYWDAISPIKHVPNVSERPLPHFIVRGADDQVVPHEAVQRYVDVLKAAGQSVTYIQVEGAGHAFFDWKPDATTRSTFANFGVKYAKQMREFFDSVFYKG